jgi:hypothetical protein
MNAAEFSELTYAAADKHKWLSTQFDSAKRRGIVSELAQECEFQITRRKLTDAATVGQIAADTVRVDPLAVPRWLNPQEYERLAETIAQWLIDHPHVAVDFAKGEMT